MTQPIIGEVRMFGGNFAPRGWAFCNGQLLAISEYEALYTLIGTTYGGNGTTNFALPDLQGRLVVGMGQGTGLSNYALGQKAGTETVTLMTTQLAGHTHTMQATTTIGNNYQPGGLLTGQIANEFMYTIPGTPAPTTGNMLPSACSQTGGTTPHENLMPSQCLTFIICLFGIFPTHP